MELVKKGSVLKAAILSFVFACATALCVAMSGQAWAATVSDATELKNAVAGADATIELSGDFALEKQSLFLLIVA